MTCRGRLRSRSFSPRLRSPAIKQQSSFLVLRVKAARSVSPSSSRCLHVRSLSPTPTEADRTLSWGAPDFRPRVGGYASRRMLRGKGLALHVRAEASDGFVAAFAWPSSMPGSVAPRRSLRISARVSLWPATLPFRLVVPSDKRGGRWVRGWSRSVLDEPGSKSDERRRTRG